METQTALDLLKHEHRRAIVATLYETSSLSWPRLVGELSVRVTDATRFPDDATRRRLRIGLYHNHLPKLAEAGAVEYDDETVTATSKLESLVTYLDDTHMNVSAELDCLGDYVDRFYA